ncbi:hypothetical protein Mapa_003679 [Marchantia paleacea]|nr:hypothetical protein Mapa_003679 [Marchantia paleacea]
MVRSNKQSYDTYGALGESLLQLEDVADKIFTSITDRVRSQHQQLRGLSSRIQTAQARVEAISGTKRATCVFSSAKYPEINPSSTDYIPISQKRRDEYHIPSTVTISLNTGQWQNGEEGTLELFQFFSETSHEHWLKDHKRKEGIGKVPSRVKSVADVILFNSTELPYHKYRIVDTLAGADQPVDEEEVVEVKRVDLPAPPQSVLGGDDTPRQGAEEYGFRPVLRQVPTFSLPSMLPDLPMVADLSWSGATGDYDQLPSIAPSAVHSAPYSPSGRSSSSRFDSGSVSTRFDPTYAAWRHDSASGDGLMQEASSRGLPRIRVSESPPPERRSRKKASDSQPSSARSRDGTKAASERGQTFMAPAPTPPPPPPPPVPPQFMRNQTAPPAGGLQLMSNTKGSEKSNPLVRAESSRAIAGNQVASNPYSAPALPVLDNQRAALLASIRDSGMNILRKTTRADGSLPSLDTSGRELSGGNDDREPNNKLTSPGPKQPLNVLAEMAKSLTLRRLSMRGASHDQMSMKSEHRPAAVDEDHASGSGDNSGKIPMPSDNAYMAAQRNEELSDDDEDDDWEE